MTTPDNTSSTPTASGTTGKISTLAGDTQPHVIDYLKGQKYPAGGGPSWWSLLQGFGSAVQGAITGLQQIITGIGGTIATDVSDTILTIQGMAHGAQTAINQIITGIGGTIATDVSNTILTIQGLANTAKNGVTNLGNALWTNAQSVIGDISHVISDGTHTLQNVWDAIGAGLGGATSGHNAATLNAQALALSVSAQGAEASAIAAQYAVAQLNQAGSATTPTGLVESLTFSGADQSALSSTNWSATGGNTSGSLVVCVGTNNTPSMGISTGATTPGTFYATSAYTYTTDNQSFEAVLGSGGSAGGTTYLLFHCNTSLTAGGYLAVSASGLDLGSFTQSGGAWTFNAPIGSLSVGLSSGNRVEVQNQGNVYQLLINGEVQKTITDTGNAITLGAAYRSAQVLMQRVYYTYNPGTPWQTLGHADSFQLAGVLLSDYIVPTYLGSTAHITRTSTTVVSAPNGVLPSSFWGANLRSTADITVDLVNGKFTVSKAAPYQVSMALASNAASNFAGTTYAASIQSVLYRNGSIEQYGNFVMQDKPAGYDGNTNVSIPQYTPVTTFDCYLSAGDYVQVGTATTVVGGGNSITGGLLGEATGKKTYFNITRLAA